MGEGLKRAFAAAKATNESHTQNLSDMGRDTVQSRPVAGQRQPSKDKLSVVRCNVQEMPASTDESKLNKTEAAYLKHLRSCGIKWIGIQNITLKLAFDCRLTVDFVYPDDRQRLVFADVKGFQREDALIKMKVAARLFPFWDFHIVSRDRDGWDVKRVNP